MSRQPPPTKCTISIVSPEDSWSASYAARSRRMVPLCSMTTIRGSSASDRSRSPNVEPVGMARGSPFTRGVIVSSGATRVLIGRKIVDRGAFGIAGIPDPPNGGDAVRSGVAEGGDVLGANPADRDAGDPGGSCDAADELRAAGRLGGVRGGGEDVSGDHPRGAGRRGGRRLLRGVHARPQ